MVKNFMKKKEIIILSAKIIATVFLFYYANKTINFSQFPKIDNIVSVFFIAAAFGFLQQFLLFCRWLFSVRILGISCGIKSVIKSYFIGQFLGTVSPARSGDLAKIFYLENTPKKLGLYAIFLDSAVALTTLFVTGLWKIYPKTDENAIQIIDKMLNVAGIIGIAGIIVLVIILRKQNFAKLFSLFSISLLQHIVLIVQGALIFSILLPISFLQASFAVASAYCIMPLVPVTVAAIGIREFSLSLLISVFVFDKNIEHTVFVAAYILLLCNSVIFMIPGIFLFYFKGKKGT